MRVMPVWRGRDTWFLDVGVVVSLAVWRMAVKETVTLLSDSVASMRSYPTLPTVASTWRSQEIVA